MKIRPVFVMSSFLAFGTMTGCKSDPTPVVMGNRIGESYSQFASISKPDTPEGSTTAYTGEVHCFEGGDGGDKCKGHSRHNGAIDAGPMPFLDNTHYTFVAGTLLKIESVGAGGLHWHSKREYQLE